MRCCQFVFLLVAVSKIIGKNVLSFSASSSFLSVTQRHINDAFRSTAAKYSKNDDGMTMYNDPTSFPEQNAWAVIASTERWISDTLRTSNQIASASSGGNNPYARKEVSYFCETSKESSMIVAGIFRMLKEARERGEAHGCDEDERSQRLDANEYTPNTMRQTQVIVIPGNSEFAKSFPLFDNLVATINQARRDARDYITDAMLEKIDNALDDDDMGREWSVAINLAHLHPKFGEKSPEQQLQEMKNEDANGGEIDVNLEEYKRARTLARRSPYPTVVLEVRATPPPDFSQAPPPPTRGTYIGKGEEGVTAADIQRLEALFGKSAICDKAMSGDDIFWNSLGSTIQEVAAVTPINMAQRWMAAYDPNLGHDDGTTVSFTETTTMHVDSAYEFVFTNIAMMMQDDSEQHHSCHYCIVMPNFLSSAATSFEKFAAQLNMLLKVLPDIGGTMDIVTFHPEHIDSEKRSPVPILALKWKKY